MSGSRKPDETTHERGSGWDDEEEPTTGVTALIPALGADDVAAPSTPRTRALLTIVAGPKLGKVYSVRDDETVIGRGTEAHVQVKGTGVSRLHARVLLEGETYVIEDLKSTNGTIVNGRRVERAALKSGDRVLVGQHVELSFAVLDAQAEKLTHQLYESSVRDPLTGAFNRRHLEERLATEVSYARRHVSMLSAIMLDVDHFKRVNDVYGHLAGDEVLRAVSGAVQRQIRAEDVLARFGGEEFTVIVRGIDHANVERLAERLRLAVHRLKVPAERSTLQVTISLGVASLGELEVNDRSGESLLRLADQRLYRAKESGRNRVCGS